MDLGKWCLEFGIKKKYEVADAVELIKAYESTYVPVYGRALPPEPRTCETCATGCLPNERVYVNPDVETPCPGWTPRSSQSADVETARSKIELAIKFGLPINARMALREALAATDPKEDLDA